MLKVKPSEIPTILSVEDYIELMGTPNKEMSLVDMQILEKWIKQATDQFDSMISPHNQNGYLYKFWDSLKPTKEDNIKGYKLQNAIAKWVECFVISGKFWVDNVPSLSSNIQYTIESSSNDSNIENKRKDIIKDLNSIGLLQTSNISDSKVNQTAVDQEIEDLIILSKGYLTQNYLGLDSVGFGQTLKSDINFANRSIQFGGNITGNNNGEAYPILSNYILKNCHIEDQNGKAWDPLVPYVKGDIVILIYVINEARDTNQDWKMSHFLCLKDNTNVYPLNDTTGTWELLEIGEVDINKIVEITYDRVVEKFNIDFLEFINTMDVKWSEFEASFTKKFEDLQVDINTLFNGLEDNIKNEYIPNELDKLPSANQVMYHKGQSYTFKDKASFDSIKVEYNVQDVDYVVESNILDITDIEKFTGKYVDGKKVYAKTFSVILPPKLTQKNTRTLILANVSKLVGQNIVSLNTNDNQYNGSIVPFVYDVENYVNLYFYNNGIYLYSSWNSQVTLTGIIEYTKTTESTDVAPIISPFYIVTFLKDILRKQLTKVVEQNEITIKEDAQTSNFDRTITLKDFANDLTQDIKIENNGVITEQIPLNYMLSENESWTGEYYREIATETAKKVYHFNKVINLTIATNERVELSCLYDVDKIVDVNFTCEHIDGGITYKVYPSHTGIVLYHDATGDTWQLLNENTQSLVFKSINVKYTKKGDA